MKNKWLVRTAFACVVVAFIYVGYGLWNNYLDERERLVGAEWVVPLSEDYTRWDDYIRTLEEDLKAQNLELVIDYSHISWNKEDDEWKRPCGVKNSQGKLIIPTIYERLDIDSQQGYILAGNYDTKKYHYYKLDGTDFIEGDFQDAYKFKNGYGCVEKDGQHMVISTTGQEIFKLKCEYLNNFDSEKGLFEFESDDSRYGYASVYGGETGLWGLVDINGKIVLEPKYDVIEKNPAENRILVMYSNKEGFQDKVYLDNNFQQVSKESYEDATAFEQGVAEVKDKRGWCIINEAEAVITRIPGCKQMHEFSQGIAVAEFNKEIRYYDNEGNVLFTVPRKGFNRKLEWGMYKFREGTIVFRGKNGKLGYMDSKGHVIVEPIFDDADPIENGKAFVEIGDKAGVIKF